MKRKSWFLTGFVCSVWMLCIVSSAMAVPRTPSGEPSRYDQKAMWILGATGVKGGLVVHIGCGDGKLTAALHAGDNYLVHGLDQDATDITASVFRIRITSSTWSWQKMSIRCPCKK
jgi:2-polyprenyl-3-methyl-5-hydroxy-6-metoxy-1,4-benzoquinol methylase